MGSIVWFSNSKHLSVIFNLLSMHINYENDKTAYKYYSLLYFTINKPITYGIYISTEIVKRLRFKPNAW